MLRRIHVADRRDEIHYMQKNPQKIAILMGYEYALLERQRNRPTNCSRGRDHNADYRWAHGTENTIDDPAALLPTTWCQLQEASLSSVCCRLRREIKEDAICHHDRSVEMEEQGSCFLVQMKSGAVTSTWVDTSAHMVGMVVQEGISSGSVEVGMDEVGKAHGTWVGTLLEVDGRAPCTDGDADADVDADVDGDVDVDADASAETSFLGLKESEIQTDNFLNTYESDW